MDRDCGCLTSGHHDHLEQVAGLIGTDHKPPVRILSGIFHDECMVDGMMDVFILNAMSAC